MTNTNNNLPRKRTIIDRFYDKYKHLAEIYAARVFNYERTGMTKEDIIQEMRIKIYTSILGYGRQWSHYRKTDKRKPVPMIFWIRTALVNKVLDFAKTFNYERVENLHKVSIFESTMDIGTFSTANMQINLNAKFELLATDDAGVLENQIIRIQSFINNWNPECELNGVDLLKGLRGERRKCYCMYVYGFDVRDLSKLFPEIDVKTLVERHSEFLRNRKSVELYDFENKTYEVEHFEEA